MALQKQPRKADKRCGIFTKQANGIGHVDLKGLQQLPQEWTSNSVHIAATEMQNGTFENVLKLTKSFFFRSMTMSMFDSETRQDAEMSFTRGQTLGTNDWFQNGLKRGDQMQHELFFKQ